MTGPAPAAADDRFGLARVTADDLRRVFEATPGIAAVWMFGSRARGTARPTADLAPAAPCPTSASKCPPAAARR